MYFNGQKKSFPPWEANRFEGCCCALKLYRGFENPSLDKHFQFIFSAGILLFLFFRLLLNFNFDFVTCQNTAHLAILFFII